MTRVGERVYDERYTGHEKKSRKELSNSSGLPIIGVGTRYDVDELPN